MAISPDLSALLDAYSMPAGISDNAGNWLVASRALKAALLPQQCESFEDVQAKPERWNATWRTVQRNRKVELYAAGLTGRLSGFMACATRIHLDSIQDAAFLIEFHPRSKLLDAFSSINRLHHDSLAYKRQRYIAARKMQKALDDAQTDPLTGIANRRAMDDYLTQQWQHAIHERRYLSVLMVDIDFFKDINDTLGHSHGDQVLKKIAACLSKTVARPTDFVARIGGEEFGVILPGTEVEGAKAMAKLMLDEVQKLALSHPTAKIAPHVTISIGCATMKPSPQDNLSDFIRTADMALYRAKQSGRNRYISDIAVKEPVRALCSMAD